MGESETCSQWARDVESVEKVTLSREGVRAAELALSRTNFRFRIHIFCLVC
jgi:hypothetical protein